VTSSQNAKILIKVVKVYVTLKSGIFLNKKEKINEYNYLNFSHNGPNRLLYCIIEWNLNAVKNAFRAQSWN